MEQIEPLVFNQYAWTNATSMLYIEQPVGTGFSTGDPPAPTNETDVAGDMYAFLQNFYKVFDQYAASRLYIFGESYAGMYVPGMGRKIYLENEKLKKLAASDVDNDSAGTPIALAGIALGNGWIDARVQGPATIGKSSCVQSGMASAVNTHTCSCSRFCILARHDGRIHSRQFACGMGTLHQQIQ